MKLSILVLTHNRPKLFIRCIESALKNKPDYCEILVNNDSHDIEEIPGATYYYENNQDISDTYKFLLGKANGEFVYFLEDDDYLTDNFFQKIHFNSDILFMNYKTENIMNDIQRKKKIFCIDEHYFQLGQIMFKKELIDFNNFPTGNKINNDWLLFCSLGGYISLIHEYVFVQTTDGKDNISFKLLNKDARFYD